MKTNATLSNVSFNFLHGSNEFLQIVLDNINCCVLLLNNKFELVSFNNAIKTMFPKSGNVNLNYKKCGDAIGCAYQVEEQKECGNTSRCSKCDIRKSAVLSYLDNEITYKKKISRPFFNQYNQKVDKMLQFSTSLFNHMGERYIIMLVESVPLSDYAENKELSGEKSGELML